MKISVLSTSGLSEETQTLLSELYKSVDKIISIGQYRMGFETAKILYGVLYWPKSAGGYLALNPITRKMYDVDWSLVRLDTNFSIDLDNVTILNEVLKECLVQASSDVYSFPRRVQRQLQSIVYSITNLFPGIKSYTGQPLNEQFIVIRVGFDFYARKVIDAGETAMKLVNSKIVDGRLFLKTDEGYFVISPKEEFGNDLFRCPDLNFDNAKAITGMSIASEREYRDQFIAWLAEAGL